MYSFAESRLFHTLSPAPTGVNRIAVIGDSMTYGSGVPPNQTMPAFLERTLNAAELSRLFQVANLARNGSNLWNAWSSFEYHLAHKGFDAVVLTICGNDTRMYDSIVRRDAKEFPWTGSFEFEVAKRTFGYVKEYAIANRLPVIVTFYSLLSTDSALSGAAADACKAAGLAFVDLQAHLADALGNHSAQTYASPFDGHPSSVVHQVAARRIADEILRLSHFRTDAAKHVDVAGNIEAAVQKMFSASRDVESCLDWGLRTVETKTLAWRRRLNKPSNISVERLDEVRSDLQSRYRAWQNHQEIAATLTAGNTSTHHQRWGLLVSFSAAMVEVDEYLFFLESGTIAGFEAHVETLLKSFVAENSAAMVTVRPDELLSAKARADRIAALLNPTNVDDATVYSAHPTLQIFCQLTRQLGVQLDRMARLLSQSSARSSCRVAVALFQIQRALNYMDSFARETAVLNDHPLDQASPYTCIDVVIEAPEGTDVPDARTFLYVTVDAVHPQRKRFTERQLCGLEARRHLYHYELPYFALGDVRVEIPVTAPGYDRVLDGRVIISSVKIYHSGASSSQAGATWVNVPSFPSASIFIPSVRPAASGPVLEEPRFFVSDSTSVDLFASKPPFDPLAWKSVRSDLSHSDESPTLGKVPTIKLVEDRTANNSHDIRRQFTSSHGEYAFSFFARGEERTRIVAWLGNFGHPDHIQVQFDLRAGTVVGQSAASAFANMRCGLVAMSDGWWWCWVTTKLPEIEQSNAMLALCDDLGRMYYDGDGKSGLQLGGIQLQRGHRPTLPLP